MLYANAGYGGDNGKVNFSNLSGLFVRLRFPASVMVMNTGPQTLNEQANPSANET